MEFPEYSSSERLADAAVHAIGVAAGLAAAVVLCILARADGVRLTALAVYAFGLLAMLVCSALYNMTKVVRYKRLFRRLDHAAIFLMIAGTYTPFALILIGGRTGVALLIFVWLVAAVGIGFKLVSPTRWEGVAIATYLLLGWTGVTVVDPLLAVLSSSGFVLLLAGGILYSAGVILHKSTRLPYHNALWHLAVLGAASCHFVVVLTDVAIAAQG